VGELSLSDLVVARNNARSSRSIRHYFCKALQFCLNEILTDFDNSLYTAHMVSLSVLVAEIILQKRPLALAHITENKESVVSSSICLGGC